MDIFNNNLRTQFNQKQDTNIVIDQYYRNPKFGFQSAAKLFHKLRNDNQNITLKQVKDYLNKQEDYQIMQEKKKPTKYNSIVASDPLECVQLDLMVYDRFENKDGYRYIMNIIDVYSRFTGSRALKDKKGSTQLKAIKDILRKILEACQKI